MKLPSEYVASALMVPRRRHGNRHPPGGAERGVEVAGGVAEERPPVQRLDGMTRRRACITPRGGGPAARRARARVPVTLVWPAPGTARGRNGWIRGKRSGLMLFPLVSKGRDAGRESRLPTLFTSPSLLLAQR